MREFITWGVIAFLCIGYGRCVYKMFSCNWEPIGKAEAVYTFGTFTATGCFIGWLNVKDK
ncbi:hypothetical protein [uncultured Mediterranean phage uvMED]|nr:hypothetical protein [uncultured Mediterranean phage uvMED]